MKELASEGVIISFLPTSFKSPHYLRPMRARDTAYFESYATDVFITLCLSPCSVEGCLQGENNVALINVSINFGYEYFSFVIHFSKIFCQNFFPKFVFWGFYSRCSPVYRDKTDSMYLCYEKYDIQANIAVSKFKIKIRNLKSKFII